MRGIASFLAGFGTGYVNAEKQKQEKERQDKMDQIVFDKAARDKEEYDAKKAVEDEAKALPTKTYSDKRDMNTSDVRGMMGGSDDPTAANYISDEAAQHYIANNTGAAQVNSNAASIAQQGVGDRLGGMTAIQNSNGQTQIADPSSAKAIPYYQRMQDTAHIYINKGNDQQKSLGYQMLAHSQTEKSNEMQRAIVAGYNKDGAAGVLQAVHGFDNDDIPVTNLRLEQPSNGYDPKNPNGGMYNVIGTVNGKEKVIRQYDPKQIPQGVSIDDIVLQDAMALTDPSKMYERRLNLITMNRQDAQNKIANDRADKADKRADDLQPYAIRNAAATATENEAKAGVAGQAAKLGLTKTQAEIDNLNADAEKKRADRNGTGKLSDNDQQQDSQIRAARAFIANRYSADKGGLKALQDEINKAGTDDLGNSKADPRLLAAYKDAVKPRPAMVKIYGTDPHLDRYVNGAKPYTKDPLPPVQMRREGATYEMSDGTHVAWDGKGLLPVK